MGAIQWDARQPKFVQLADEMRASGASSVILRYAELRPWDLAWTLDP